MADDYIRMYERLPSLVLGFHGCDRATFENVLYKNEKLKDSNNTYDWLGNGMYFWENSYQRAYDWAAGKYMDPAVIGAVIALGKCLNLTDYHSSEILKRGYEILKLNLDALKMSLPKNKKMDKNGDLLLRDLDCAVIQQIHDYHKEQRITPYDSVRGVFFEGAPSFPGSEIREKTHIQLCVVNPNCIKGFFCPREVNDGYNVP